MRIWQPWLAQLNARGKESYHYLSSDVYLCISLCVCLISLHFGAYFVSLLVPLSRHLRFPFPIRYSFYLIIGPFHFPHLHYLYRCPGSAARAAHLHAPASGRAGGSGQDQRPRDRHAGQHVCLPALPPSPPPLSVHDETHVHRRHGLMACWVHSACRNTGGGGAGEGRGWMGARDVTAARQPLQLVTQARHVTL